ncbi:MAG TPA: AMP-binding protein, partial [Bacteroidales bacterium]|nr:AMP-binding protein [Bacteroidales bacterium]
KLVPDMELTIRDEDGNILPEGEKGEIVIKGPNVMHSYWKNEKATKETIRDGWLYTGDLGHMGHEGFLYVLGRFKSLLISNDGEKHSPEGIEETITEHTPLIEQMILHNNQDPYTIGLVYINKEKAKRLAEENNVDLTKDEGKKKILDELNNTFNRYKADGEHPDLFPERWLPTTFAVLAEGFTEENKMLNSTMKIVRGKITEHYAETIAFLYTPAGKDIYNERNIAILNQLFG